MIGEADFGQRHGLDRLLLAIAFDSFGGGAHVAEEQKAGHGGLDWVFVAGDDAERDNLPGRMIWALVRVCGRICYHHHMANGMTGNGETRKRARWRAGMNGVTPFSQSPAQEYPLSPACWLIDREASFWTAVLYRVILLL